MWRDRSAVGNGHYLDLAAPWFLLKAHFLTFLMLSIPLVFSAADQIKSTFFRDNDERQNILIAWLWGSFVLHLLVGFWWDQVWNRWDGSQLLPSQTPTTFFGLILNSVPKRKFNKHKIATISSHQNPTKSLYVLSFSFPFHLWKVGFGWDEWLVTCVEKWKLTKILKTNDDWTL